MRLSILNSAHTLYAHAGAKMIDLYYSPTPNGHKKTRFLEEAELA